MTNIFIMITLGSTDIANINSEISDFNNKIKIIKTGDGNDVNDTTNYKLTAQFMLNANNMNATRVDNKYNSINITQNPTNNKHELCTHVIFQFTLAQNNDTINAATLLWVYVNTNSMNVYNKYNYSNPDQFTQDTQFEYTINLIPAAITTTSTQTLSTAVMPNHAQQQPHNASTTPQLLQHSPTVITNLVNGAQDGLASSSTLSAVDPAINVDQISASHVVSTDDLVTNLVNGSQDVLASSSTLSAVNPAINADQISASPVVSTDDLVTNLVNGAQDVLASSSTLSAVDPATTAITELVHVALSVLTHVTNTDIVKPPTTTTTTTTTTAPTTTTTSNAPTTTTTTTAPTTTTTTTTTTPTTSNAPNAVDVDALAKIGPALVPPMNDKGESKPPTIQQSIISSQINPNVTDTFINNIKKLYAVYADGMDNPNSSIHSFDILLNYKPSQLQGGSITYTTQDPLTSETIKTIEFNSNATPDQGRQNIIIIGGGPVGLYMSILLRTLYPNLEINILESRHNNFKRKLERCQVLNLDKLTARSENHQVSFLSKMKPVIPHKYIDTFIQVPPSNRYSTIFSLIYFLNSIPPIKLNMDTGQFQSLPINILEYQLANYAQSIGVNILHTIPITNENLKAHVTNQTKLIFDATGGHFRDIEYTKPPVESANQTNNDWYSYCGTVTTIDKLNNTPNIVNPRIVINPTYGSVLYTQSVLDMNNPVNIDYSKFSFTDKTQPSPFKIQIGILPIEHAITKYNDIYLISIGDSFIKSSFLKGYGLFYGFTVSFLIAMEIYNTQFITPEP